MNPLQMFSMVVFWSESRISFQVLWKTPKCFLWNSGPENKFRLAALKLITSLVANWLPKHGTAAGQTEFGSKGTSCGLEVRDRNIFKLSFAPWVRENRIWGDMRDEENIEKLNLHKRNLHTLSNTEPIWYRFECVMVWRTLDCFVCNAMLPVICEGIWDRVRVGESGWGVLKMNNDAVIKN